MFWKDFCGDLIVGIQEWRQDDQLGGGYSSQIRDHDELWRWGSVEG